MDADVRDSLRDAVVREAVALAVLGVLLWAVGPGRVLVPAWLAKARALLGRRDPHEAQVRQFGREVSEWDHEQAAHPDRPPAAGGGCGCG